MHLFFYSCDLLKNSYLCLLNNTRLTIWMISLMLWFAEKFVSLLIEQHQILSFQVSRGRCDLLKNSYLCLLNNTMYEHVSAAKLVVICWKIRIFAYWTTPGQRWGATPQRLWFAEKFVSLLIEQHPNIPKAQVHGGCDLLKNSYLCLLNNTHIVLPLHEAYVVICWKIRIFAYWTTPNIKWFNIRAGCDLLKNSYLCLLNNTTGCYRSL